MLKNHNDEVPGLCITQILREINFGDSKSAKSAILTHLEALNFDLNEFLHFWEAEIDQSNKFRAPKRQF